MSLVCFKASRKVGRGSGNTSDISEIVSELFASSANPKSRPDRPLGLIRPRFAVSLDDQHGRAADE